MKAAVLDAFHSPLKIVEKPIPVPGPGEVLVQVCASGLCSSDLHIQDGIIPTVRTPYTPGHELSGIVAALGEGVTDVQVGTHMVAAIDVICGKCRYCRSGRTNLCRSLVRLGFERDGSHEEYCVIPAENVVPIGNSVPFEQATGITDAVGCMYNALKNRARLQPGQRLLVLGTGGLGMNAIQLGKLFGAEVYATSRREEKLNIALEMGADAVINTRTQDLRKEIDRLTRGELCDVVLDCIGIRGSINESLQVTCPGGKVIVVGYQEPEFTADYQDVMKLEKEILGMRGMTRQDTFEVAALVSSGKLTPYVYKTLPLKQINEGLQMLRDGTAPGRVVLLTDAGMAYQNNQQ